MEGISKGKAATIKSKVADFILSEIENFTNAMTSPVTGREFRALSFAYGEKKRDINGSIDADLHLTGGMIGSLKTRLTDNGIELFIDDSIEILKAYNHNVGDTLPKRQFIPQDDQKFVKSIRVGVKNLIKDELGD